MGTWGAGNFDDDGALDYVGDVIDGFCQTIEDVLSDEDRSGLDEEGEAVVMPTIAMISAIVECCYAATPKVETVESWERRYLAIYDAQIDGRDPSPGFKEERRQVIVETFGKLKSAAIRFWSE